MSKPRDFGAVMAVSSLEETCSYTLFPKTYCPRTALHDIRSPRILSSTKESKICLVRYAPLKTLTAKVAFSNDIVCCWDCMTSVVNGWTWEHWRSDTGRKNRSTATVFVCRWKILSFPEIRYRQVINGWMSVEQWWNSTDSWKSKCLQGGGEMCTPLPPQIPHWLAWGLTRDYAQRGQPITVSRGTAIWSCMGV